MRKKTFLAITMGLALGLILSAPAPSTWASVAVPQTPLLGSTVTKYATGLPIFGDTGRVHGTDISVYYEEFQQNVLPDAFYTTLPTSFALPNDALARSIDPSQGTYVWGYRVGAFGHLYPAHTVVATKGIATTMHYFNTLPASPILQQYLTIDQTIHWADPLNEMGSTAPYGWPTYPTAGGFVGAPQPVVTHLHGAEVASAFDGGPDQWFTPNGIHGPFYRTYSATSTNSSVYQYPNQQEAATLWFHDHGLGITRINVYGGLAAFYLLRDNYDTGQVNPTAGPVANPSNLPAGVYEQEIVIQDRQFDTNGQLLFPDGAPAGLNGPPTAPTIHPYWNPEFFGDVIVVNGRSWPFFQVEPRRYRFRLLNGSNARFYTLKMSMVTPIPGSTLRNSKARKGGAQGSAGPAFWVIGTDGGLLDAPVAVSELTFAPGERYDVIVDFAGFGGTNITVTNSAKAPFPAGTNPDKATTAEILQFRVTAALAGADTSFDPSVAGVTLRGGINVAGQPAGTTQPPIIERLVDPATGTANVTPDVTRQLVLREVMGPTGPIEVLVNNTKWNGISSDGTTPVSGSTQYGPNWVTELPQVGSTELWEIINLTGDAHPIHLHLVQFQVMNRQTFQLTKYTNAYTAAFPANVTIDAYGSPMDYSTPNADGALGGNPAISGYLQGKASPPNPEEAGWKDTAINYPGQVTRYMVRWAPQDAAVGSTTPGVNPYPWGNPAVATGYTNSPATTLADETPGYVWHCHIIDHEDNEMMRPYQVTQPAP
jgi:spore coat protein A